VLPVIEGEHAERRQPLEDRQEVALLLPVSGG
jgi:molybdopterin converting factor small subunit